MDGLHDLVEQVLSRNNQRVHDISKWLLQPGYFVLAGNDLLAYMQASDSLSRVVILDRLNREKARMEGWA